jgi:transcriptional regulator with XRE-family HTH domain
MARQSIVSLRIRLGRRIEQLKESHGWSYTYLAEHSGVARSTLQEVVKGSNDARLSTIDALAGSFGMTFQELLRNL